MYAIAGPEAHGKDFDRQVAGINVRIAVLDGYTTLGIPDTEPFEITLSGEREAPVFRRFVHQIRPEATNAGSTH